MKNLLEIANEIESGEYVLPDGKKRYRISHELAREIVESIKYHSKIQAFTYTGGGIYYKQDDDLLKDKLLSHDATKVYCNKCRYYRGNYECGIKKLYHITPTTKKSYFACVSTVNKNNDCKNFQPKLSFWQKITFFFAGDN